MKLKANEKIMWIIQLGAIYLHGPKISSFKQFFCKEPNQNTWMCN